ncbi:hypothetical protein BH20ACI4_BH20ACI4_35300 [soil metagenome]
MNCRKCDQEIPAKMKIDGIERNLQNRKYCLLCSPFKTNNRQKLELNATINEGTKRFCSECLKEFVFHRHRAMTVLICSACISKNKRRNLKLKAVEYKGGKCSNCGYNKCVGALDFHHLNPQKKDFTISGNSGKWENLKIELDKCILLCKNCHAELHYK